MKLTHFAITIYEFEGKVWTYLDKHTHYCHVLHLHLEIKRHEIPTAMAVI